MYNQKVTIIDLLGLGLTGRDGGNFLKLGAPSKNTDFLLLPNTHKLGHCLFCGIRSGSLGKQPPSGFDRGFQLFQKTFPFKVSYKSEDKRQRETELEEKKRSGAKGRQFQTRRQLKVGGCEERGRMFSNLGRNMIEITEADTKLNE